MIETYLHYLHLIISIRCQIEGLEIRDGGTEFSPLLGIFCRDKPHTLKSTGNTMYVKYYTNSNTPNTGFNAHVSTGMSSTVTQFLQLYKY